jgi:hypothetical protein
MKESTKNRLIALFFIGAFLLGAYFDSLTLRGL